MANELTVEVRVLENIIFSANIRECEYIKNNNNENYLKTVNEKKRRAKESNNKDDRSVSRSSPMQC